MSFAEIRFSTNLSRGSGGYGFKNVTSAGSSGLEGRVGHTSIPLFTGDIGNIYVDEVELQYLIAFFNARKGRSQGFRYKYHADYSCTNTPEIIDDYSFTQGVTIPAIADGVTRDFQMAKLYDNCGEQTVKPLYKIVPNTTLVYVNGSEQTNANVDVTTGKISLSSTPPVGAKITHSCEFDLPVRFDIDELVGIQEVLDTRTGEKLYTFSNLPIVEFVLSPSIALRVPQSRFPAYIGFTSATGGLSSNHDLLYASVNEQIIIGGGSTEDLVLNGVATILTNNVVRLTPDFGNRAGSCFYAKQVNSLLSKLKIYFVFKIIGRSNRNSVADGIACLITASNTGTTTLTPGGGIGYDGSANTLAVEYDTYFNTDRDPNGNHVGISTVGSTRNDLTVTPNFDIYGGERHSWIEYNFSAKILDVYLSLTSDKPAVPLISTSVDIEEIFLKTSN